MKIYSRIAAVLVAVCMLAGLSACSLHSWSARFDVEGTSGLTTEQIETYKTKAAEAEAEKAAEEAAAVSDTTAEAAVSDTTAEAEVVETETEPTEVKAAPLSGQIELSAGFYAACVLYTYDNLANDGTISAYVPLSEQTVEDTPADEYIDQQAQKMLKAYIVATRQLSQLGLSYNREDYFYYTYYESSYENYKEYYEANGVGLDSFMRAALDYNMVLNEVYNARYGENGYEEVSDETLMEYYKNNFVRATLIQQNFVGDDGAALTDDQKNEIIAQFNSYLNSFKNGDTSIDDVAAQFTNDTSDNTVSRSKALVKADETDDTTAAIMAVNVGEYGIYQDENSISVFRKDEVNYDEGKEFEEYRSSILSYYKYDEFVDELAAIADGAADIEINKAVLKQLSVKKLPLNNYDK